MQCGFFFLRNTKVSPHNFNWRPKNCLENMFSLLSSLPFFTHLVFFLANPLPTFPNKYSTESTKCVCSTWWLPLSFKCYYHNLRIQRGNTYTHKQNFPWNKKKKKNITVIYQCIFCWQWPQNFFWAFLFFHCHFSLVECFNTPFGFWSIKMMACVFFFYKFSHLLFRWHRHI